MIVNNWKMGKSDFIRVRRVSMGLTVSRKRAKYLAVRRKN